MVCDLGGSRCGTLGSPIRTDRSGTANTVAGRARPSVRLASDGKQRVLLHPYHVSAKPQLLLPVCLPVSNPRFRDLSTIRSCGGHCSGCPRSDPTLVFLLRTFRERPI